MRILSSFVLLALVGASAAARSGGSGDGPSASALAAFDRDTFVIASAIVEGAFGAARGVELALGRDPDRSLAGLQIAVATPCLIYGANLARAGAWDDPFVVGSTALAAALIAHSIVVLASPRRVEPLRVTVGPGSIGYALEF